MQAKGVDRRRDAMAGEIDDQNPEPVLIQLKYRPQVATQFGGGFEMSAQPQTAPGTNFGPFAVGEYREIVEHRLKIVGRTREAISFTTSPVVFMDYRIAQAIDPISLSGRTTYIVVKLAPGADIAAVSAELRRRLPHNDIHSKAEWRDISRDYWVTNTGIGLNMYVSAFLGALVGVVIVAQTLYASTMAHLREFGVIKAIGGSNADCYKILAQQGDIRGNLFTETMLHKQIDCTLRCPSLTTMTLADRVTVILSPVLVTIAPSGVGVRFLVRLDLAYSCSIFAAVFGLSVR
ncbi:hypothetical protein WCLP8_4000003 [uncultured Gammaproteobacteria bacterium]